VVSISLADNRLTSCHAISTICQYLPELQNLSLQNNLLSNYKSLEQLKGPHKLKKLRELILIGNPVREEAIAHTGNDIVYRRYCRLTNIEHLLIFYYY
jgi:nuclear RNA export factor